MYNLNEKFRETSKNKAFKLFNFLIKHNKLLVFSLCFTAFAGTAMAQRFVGFTDRFDNGTLEFSFRNNQGNRPPFVIWETGTPNSFGLNEADDVLKIRYNRPEGVGAFDHFTFHPLRAMSVDNNPRIQIDVKSDVAFKLTVSPTYSEEPPTVEYLEKEIPGNNQWNTYIFDLTPKYFSGKEVHTVDFYVDRGDASSKSANIEMDNFRMAWYLIKATDLKAELADGNNIHLSWNSTNKERTSKYFIYRSSSPDFSPSKENKIAESETTEFQDKNLDAYHHYFYKVIPVSNDGEVFFASEVVGAETFIPGVNPVVKVSNVNNAKVKKYEKFEMNLDLANVGIENPYDPADIDVYAEFTSPSGKKIKINGFYDNFQGANAWKIRFSPNETGKYDYQVFATDIGGTGKSEPGSFTAIESEHHGWIKPSDNNPHYFEYDDGTSYFGVGVYSPWRNDQERFDTMEKNGVNLMGLWDITYGGFVNGTGLIEEELGRYNQEKLGRMDSLLSIFEKSDIKLMFAIWPHDLFSETVWAAQWGQNPYNQLTDVEDVYSDSLVWEYQKQKYRYLIARFAHSRSWGIWELINEMNGTDGWAMGRHDECYEWVAKCQKYFNEHDPYNHPMTASFSGGFEEYREPLYERNDIPNIHMYPAQGWPMKYTGDTLRSAMYNYAWASRRFWDAFEKPAVFGEAGAGLAYYNIRDEKYHISYHNQIWAALTNGLAATPVWWDYPVLNEMDWQSLKHLSSFVQDIDFANLPFQPVTAATSGADVYVMDSGEKAFGWVRSFENDNVNGLKFSIAKSEGEKFNVIWYDTWTGKEFKKEKITSKNGALEITVPKMNQPHADVAFMLVKS